MDGDFDGFADVGETITYAFAVSNTGNVTLSDVTVTDPLVTVVGGPTTLDVGETDSTTFTGSYLITQADIDAGFVFNLALAEGEDPQGDPASDEDDNNEPLPQNPSIDVEKLVSVDGGLTFVDADSPTGPTLVNTAGIDPQFKLVVTNTGNVTLTNVVVTDTLGTPATGDDVTYNVGTLNVGSGETVIDIYTLPWEFGQHTNTATADSNQDATDSDDANYFGMYGGLVTNSSLCTFGETFNLIFTPDFKLGGGNYKLSDSNPGQFFYNLFYQGDAGDEVDFTLEIPFPFVTQGATPIHVYDDVTVETDLNGEICLTPVGEIANYKLTDAGVTWAYNDTNANAVADVGDTYTLTIENVDTGDDGFIYLNLHLDYGLEKQTGWIRSSPAAGTDNAVDNPNLAGTVPTILDGHEYEFSADANGGDIVGSEDSIFNDNIFKKLKGVGGLFQADDSLTLDPDEIALEGQKVVITDSTDVVRGTATTDADGWYYTEFLATGKLAQYKAYWDQDGDGNHLEESADHIHSFAMGGSAGKWAQADFTVVDPVGYDPAGDTAADLNLIADYVIDGYGAIL